MATERTLVLVKPDAMQRGMAGEILARLERRGLKIIGAKLVQADRALAERHYAEHVDKPFYPLLEAFVTSAPVIALVAEGPEAISVVRTMMGPTQGRDAPPGTIRGDYGLSRQMNLMHGSDSPQAAEREIDIYFSAEELLDYETTQGGWVCAEDEK